MMLGRAGDIKSDTYAFGITMWETLTGCVPFEGLSANEIETLVRVGKRPETSEEGRKNLPLHSEAERLIESCWAQGN